MKNVMAKKPVGRPVEPGSLTNAEHQLLWRNRQKEELRQLRFIVAHVAKISEIREIFVEKGFGETIETAEKALASGHLDE